MPTESVISRRSFLKFGVLATAAIAAGPQILRAAAVGRERSLSFLNLHTDEKLKIVYWADGQYVPESLTAINKVLRDHRTGAVHPIEPKLLDLLSELRTNLDTTESFHIISGYRSPETNAMLRGQSTGVAKHSLHMDGMAADIRVPGRTLELIRKAAISLKSGGVGYYPSQFVHVDVGRVRTW
jgi:uncharacterized protein YcbK (DUF882 family)